MKIHRLIALLIPLALLTAAVGADKPADTVIAQPAFGKPAPEITATNLLGKPVTLASLKGKPIVMQFGSLTEPVVRMHAKDIEKLATAVGQKATFLFVYEKEAHPAGTTSSLQLNNDDGLTLAEATSADERLKRAMELADKLTIAHQQVLVDDFSNATAKRFGNLPNMTFLVDANGNLAAAYPWADPIKIKLALNDLLAGKPVADANMGPTRTDQQPITIPDGLGNQGPGAGVVSAAVLLDGMTLGEQQRNAVTKSLVTYVATLRSLKEKADKAANATQPATAPAPNKSVEMQKVAEAAKDLRATLKTHLKPDDYQKMVDALSQGAGKALFAGAN